MAEEGNEQVGLEQAVEENNVRAAVEVLKAVGTYGEVKPPSGEVAPELVMVKQAEAWAEAKLAKRGAKRVWGLVSAGRKWKRAGGASWGHGHGGEGCGWCVVGPSGAVWARGHE